MIMIPQRVDCPRPPVAVLVLDSTALVRLCNFGLGPGGLSAGEHQCEDRAASVLVLLGHDRVGTIYRNVIVWCSDARERSPQC